MLPAVGWNKWRLGMYVLGVDDRIVPDSSGTFVDWSRLRHPDPSASLLQNEVKLSGADTCRRPFFSRYQMTLSRYF
jgi:hypothetical protein